MKLNFNTYQALNIELIVSPDSLNLLLSGDPRFLNLSKCLFTRHSCGLLILCFLLYLLLLGSGFGLGALRLPFCGELGGQLSFKPKPLFFGSETSHLRNPLLVQSFRILTLCLDFLN